MNQVIHNATWCWKSTLTMAIKLFSERVWDWLTRTKCCTAQIIFNQNYHRVKLTIFTPIALFSPKATENIWIDMTLLLYITMTCFSFIMVNPINFSLTLCPYESTKVAKLKDPSSYNFPRIAEASKEPWLINSILNMNILNTQLSFPI